ncbi:4281_t:CDS:2, partial [Cetraspora pellucida]
LGGILYGRSCGDSYTTIAKNVKSKKQSGRKPIFGALELDELKRMVIQYTKHCHLSTQEIKDLWNKEKINQQFSASHNIQVWRTPAKEFDESCLVPTMGQSPGLMFWACFSWHGLGLIVPIYSKVNGEVYVKLIRRHTLCAVRQLVPNSQGIFQQNNTTPHKYWKVKAAFSRAGIPILPWLAQSSDLNPIENMWQE